MRLRLVAKHVAEILATMTVLAAVLALAACAPLPRLEAGSPELQFVVPAGTAAAEMRGEPSFSFPSEIRIAPGQTIAVRNEDEAMHYFFYAPVAPGQTLRKTFAEPGVFGYSGALSCSLANRTSLTVVVGDGGPGR